MGTEKRTQIFKVVKPASPCPESFSHRKLEKAHLGGVIFGCTDSTIKECLSKQLFGLPAVHFIYVKNIDSGLPLFLFNYTKRALHGIFEAASPGQMKINPYAWTHDGSEKTLFPAQVQICVMKNCHPLLEKQFEPIIRGNYYTPNHFHFELDHAQVSKLKSLFSAQVVAPSAPMIRSTVNWKLINQRQPEPKAREDDGFIPSDAYVHSTPCNESNGHLGLADPTSCLDGDHQPIGADIEAVGKDELELICEKLQKLAENREPLDSYPVSQVHESPNANMMYTKDDGSREEKMAEKENIKDSPLSPSDFPPIITQLMLEVQELKAFKQDQTEEMGQLKQQLLNSETEVQRLRDRCTMLESLLGNVESYTSGTMKLCSEQHQDPDATILLAGGYDGESWLATLESYSPSKDIIKSLRPMSSVRSYASLTNLNGDLYVIGGGGNAGLWYNTVESYNRVNNDWRSLPCLNKKKGSLAAATLHDKVFAIGGANGIECFSDVEMFDLDVGRWISARSMLQKRFALAAVELNGALYAVGGFDGKDYLRSAERFDPREHSWSRLESMNSKRGCHSMVVLNEKLYAIGGFDGNSMVASVEAFDPRRGSWTVEAPMNQSRGYSAAVALGDKIYAIGGLEKDENFVEKIEQYQEGGGWQVTNLKAVGKRCFASAIVF